MGDDFLVRMAEVFHVAADLPPEEREAYLDERCGGEAALRAEVEALLPHLDGERLAAAGVHAESDAAPSPFPDPKQVGAFELLSVIGEGGFGVVYLARQSEPIRRTVAVKVLKPGMDTRQVVARFEAERQALALMDHPGIAHVLDAGTTPDGRPYFAMEHVTGARITAHCDRGRLPTEARIELFIELCEAVQHAHQRGIIHRDLKPSNVLVDTIGDRTLPKVIDFGIAKALGAPLTDSTLFTDRGQMIGTPEYMSPEQAERAGVDVDTRADIYALGVILYELLTGTLPLDARSLRSGTPAEIQHRLREEEPRKPSTRISPRDDTSREAARMQRTEPRLLRRRLRGDLDWIVMKALEKDRTRRYASASEFAADLRRHLDHEPVSAGPPGAAYRLRKFARRNRTAVTAAALVTLALIAGIAGTTWGLLRARTERDDAIVARVEADRLRGEERRQRKAADEARLREAAQRRAAEQAVSFLVKMLGAADPEITLRPDTRLRDVLHAADAAVQSHFADRPRAEAKVRWALGHVHLAIGEYRKARPHLQRALVIIRQSASANGHEKFRTLMDLHRVEDALGGSDAGGPYGGEAFAIGCGLLVKDLPEVRPSLDALRFAGTHFPVRLRRLAAIVAKRVTTDDPLYPVILDLLWLSIKHQARLGFDDVCESTCRVLLELQNAALPCNHPHIARTLDRLGLSMLAQARNDEALKCFRRALQLSRKVLPADHWLLAYRECMLAARDDFPAGRHEAADSVFRSRGPIVHDALGPQNIHNRTLLRQRLRLYDAWGRPESAARVRIELASIEQSTWDESRPHLALRHPELTRDLDRLRRALLDHEAGTDELLKAVIARRPATEGVDGAADRLGALHYGDLLHDWGASAAAQSLGVALRLLVEARDVRLLTLGHDHLKTGLTLLALARAEEAAGAFDAGAGHASESARILEGAHGPDHSSVHTARSILGGCLTGRREFARAELLVTESYRALFAKEESLGTEADLLRAYQRVTHLYAAWREQGRPPADHTERLAALQALRPSPQRYTANLRMARALEQRGEYAAAYQAFCSALRLNRGVILTHAGAAWVAALRFDRAAARRHLEESLLLGPRAPAAWLMAARTHSRLGEADAALRCQRRAVQLAKETGGKKVRPKRPIQLAPYLNNLGVMLRRRSGRVAPAAEAFRAALRLDPRYSLAQANLAYMNLERGEFSEAIEAARKALELNPDQRAAVRFARAVMGLALVRSGSTTEGLDCLLRATDAGLRPNATHWAWPAEAIAAANAFERGRTFHEQQIRRWPEEPHAWTALARFLINTGGASAEDHKQGLAAARKAVALSRMNCPIALANLAEALFANGRSSEAAAAVQQAITAAEGRYFPSFRPADVAAKLSRYRRRRP